VQRFSPGDPAVEEVGFAGDLVTLHLAGDRSQSAPERAASQQRAIRDELETYFEPDDGFDRIIGINTIDGLRVYFANGDIAHIRPSGNAPQLRLYACADTQARAEEIVAMGIREPDGILRRLEAILKT
jgi:phosphomannomutase